VRTYLQIIIAIHNHNIIYDIISVDSLEVLDEQWRLWEQTLTDSTSVDQQQLQGPNQDITGNGAKLPFFYVFCHQIL